VGQSGFLATCFALLLRLLDGPGLSAASFVAEAPAPHHAEHDLASILTNKN